MTERSARPPGDRPGTLRPPAEVDHPRPCVPSSTQQTYHQKGCRLMGGKAEKKGHMRFNTRHHGIEATHELRTTVPSQCPPPCHLAPWSGAVEPFQPSVHVYVGFNITGRASLAHSPRPAREPRPNGARGEQRKMGGPELAIGGQTYAIPSSTRRQGVGGILLWFW